MHKLIFSTGNSYKFTHAREVCEAYDVELIQNEQEIDEIQGEDGEKIVIDKVNKAYEILKKPVIVSDDNWEITGLNGFPGAYMKSMFHWFKAEDFIRLTKDLEDRRIFLVGYLAYKDDKITKIFRQKREGYLLTEPRGNNETSGGQIISMVGDNGLSINEVYDSGQPHNEREVTKIWHDFAKWYKDFLN